MQSISSSHLSSGVANPAIATAIALTLGAVYLKAIEESSALPKTSTRPSSTTTEMRETPAEENMLGAIEQLPDDLKDLIFSHLLPLLPIYKVITLRNMAMQSPENRWAQMTIDTFFNQALALPHQDRPTLKQFQDFLRLEKQIKAHREKINTLINTLKAERGEPSRQWSFYLGVVPYTKSIHATHTVTATFIPDASTGTLNLEHALKCKIHEFNEQQIPRLPPTIRIQSLQVLMQEPAWQPSFMQTPQAPASFLVGFDTTKLENLATHLQPEIEISDYIDLLEKHLTQFEKMPFIYCSRAGVNQHFFQFGAQSLTEMIRPN